MSRKFILIVLSLLVSVPLWSPPLIGISVGQRYDDLMSRVESSGFARVEQEYKQGWFSSAATDRFELVFPESVTVDLNKTEAPEPLRFSIVSRIEHGLFPLERLRGGTLSPVQALINTRIESSDHSLFPADLALSFDTEVDLRGNGLLRVDMPKTASTNKPTMRFDGVRGHISFKPDLASINTDLHMPLLTVAEAGRGFLKIQGVKLKSNSEKGPSGLMLGGGYFEIDSIQFREQQSETNVNLSGLRMSAESSAQDELAEIAVEYSVAQLSVNGESYAPSEIRVKFGRLPAPVLAEMQKALEDLQGQEALPDSYRALAASSIMLTHFDDVLRSDPEFLIESLVVTTPDGLIEGSLSLRPKELRIKDVSNIPALLQKLNAEASLRIPERLVFLMMESGMRQSVEQKDQDQADSGDSKEMQIREAIRLQLDQLLQQQLVVRQEQYLSTEIRLGGGLLTVNGKTIPTEIPRTP